MKKLALSLWAISMTGLVVYLAWGAVVCTPLGSLTTALSLCKPVADEVSWAAAINNNFDVLDALYAGPTSAKLSAITDVNGNAWIVQVATAAAVNGLQISGDVTGGPVILSPGGTSSDANVVLRLKGKGTRGLSFPTVTFAALPSSPEAGEVFLCSNCNSANPCTAGGAGALAKRISNAWVCN
jgi:hypothetical protein